jgi:hypothetical protein
MALLQKEIGTWGGDVENRGESGTLHSLAIENSTKLSTSSKRLSAMLRSLL